MTTHYNKLVRDKIPAYIKGKGSDCSYHIADDTEYWIKLKEKLLEEFNEFKADESVEEFADLLEVVEAIRLYKKFDPVEITRVREAKVSERGAFNDRVILDEA